MTDALSVSDLFTRRLHLQWYEGVALVRGVTEQSLQQQGTGLRIPELHQIEIASDGSVAIAGGVVTSEPVRRLGQLLQATLTDTEAPVQLRLIVSQATAPISTYASLVEFDEALGFFERPDRVGVLKAVFARAQAAGPVTGDRAAVTLDRIAPLPENATDRLPTYRARKGSRRLVGWAVAAIVVLVLASAAGLYARRTGMKVEDRTAASATAVADALGTTMLAGISTVSDIAGLGRIVPAHAAEPAPAPEAALPPAPQPVMKAKRRVAAPAESSATGDERFAPHTVTIYEVPADRATTGETPANETAALDPAADAPGDWVIYTADAVDVSAPVGVRPQLPRQLPPNVKPADLVHIELTIARDGSVELARLLRPRYHILGGMLLSAAKNWEFHPATRYGVPVRFRKTILVSFE